MDGGQTTLDVPDPPANVGINGDGDSATITWQEPDDHNSPITNYTVTARLKTSPFSEMSVWTTENSYEFDGNLAGGYQAWTIFVTATNAIGTSGPSIADTEPPLTPAAPTVLAGNGQVTVSVTRRNPARRPPPTWSRTSRPRPVPTSSPPRQPPAS